MPRNDGKKNLPPTRPGPNGTTLFLADDGNYYPSSLDTYAAKIRELATTDSIDNYHWEAGENGAPQQLVRDRSIIPPRLESRRVEALDRRVGSLEAIVALSQPILCFAPDRQAGAFNNQIYGERVGTLANQTSNVNAAFDNLWWTTFRRNGNAAAARMERFFGRAPDFHSLVDPNRGPVPIVWIIEDYVSATIAAGACEVLFGFFEHVTAATANTLVGVGFKATATHVWETFVNDCPGSVLPVTVRRNTSIAGKLSTVSHRLTIVIDGRSKTIIWYIDRVEVDRWTPGAALDQMKAAPGPLFGYAAIVPALGDVTVRINAGGQPQLRVLV